MHMKTVHTGIAVALAVAVIAVFFIFPGLSPFRQAAPPSGQNDVSDVTINTNPQNAPTTMPTENPNQLQVTDEIVGTGATAVAAEDVPRFASVLKVDVETLYRKGRPS